MRARLFLQAIGKLTAGFLLIALLLFLPAGTLRYPNGRLFPGLPYIPIIVKRIKNEEAVLTAGPAGCDTCRARVRYRLIPFIR